MAQGSPLCSVLGCYEPDRLLMWCLSRFLACRGAAARVHFWYTPDSYDKNLPADVAPEKLEPDKRIRGARSTTAAASVLMLVFCHC